jgi:cold shock protein
MLQPCCSSGRDFAPHFLQTVPRGSALVLHSSFTSIRLHRGLSPPSSHLILRVGCRKMIELQEGETEMPTGTVKWFNTQKGFGFIQPDDGSTDVFVHISAVEQSGLGGLNDGQKFAYETEAGRRPGQVSAVNLKAL